MKHSDLMVAKAEAERFLVRVQTLLKRNQAPAVADSQNTYLYDNPREQGAVKRSSMDLTRALAQLRKRS